MFYLSPHHNWPSAWLRGHISNDERFGIVVLLFTYYNLGVWTHHWEIFKVFIYMYIVNFIDLEDELSPLNSLASLSLHAIRNCRCEKGYWKLPTIVLWDFLPNWAKVVNTRIIEFTSMMNFQKSKCLFKNGFPEEENAVFM